MKPAVISKAQRYSGLTSGVDCSFRIALGQSKWLLAKNVLSCLCGSDHLLRMHGMGSTKDYGLNITISQQRFETFGKTQPVSFCKCPYLRRDGPCRAGNKTYEITSLGGLDECFPPPAQPYDGRIDHDAP